MPVNDPLATVEVRWFFDGAAASHTALAEWFENATLPAQSGNAPSLKWRDRTDTYLLLPSSDDMGIKLREGQLQIKGRVSSLGAQSFSGRHEGVLERWVKWSYAELPASYYALFGADLGAELATVAVRKRRALRKMLLDVELGTVTRVSTDAVIDRGLGFELTDLEVAGRKYCTVGFEAYPQDAAIEALALDTVCILVDQLEGIQLTARNSCSYPAWLRRLATI